MQDMQAKHIELRVNRTEHEMISRKPAFVAVSKESESEMVYIELTVYVMVLYVIF